MTEIAGSALFSFRHGLGIFCGLDVSGQRLATSALNPN
jgi:hypothetical protein